MSEKMKEEYIVGVKKKQVNEWKKIQKLFSRWTKLLPAGYVMLLAYSCLGFYFYYSVFSVPIFSFLNLEELIIASIADLIPVLFSLIIVHILTYLYEVGVNILVFTLLVVIKIKRIWQGKFDFNTIRSGPINVSTTSFIFWHVFMAVFLYIISPVSPILKWIFISYDILIGLVFLLFLYRKKVNLNVKLLLYMSILFQFQILNKTHKAQKIELEGETSQIRFLYEKKAITTDTVYSFIGRTRDYIFIFDRLNEVTEVFPVNEISNFSISKE